MKFYLKDANLKKNYPEKNTEILEIDLRRMTRALEIYLTEFVEGIPLEEFHKKSYIEDIDRVKVDINQDYDFVIIKITI